jgi:hypothetical protein
MKENDGDTPLILLKHHIKVCYSEYSFFLTVMESSNICL